ncbi:MAG: NUDIX hydrolase, partial [Chloroflexi bacterium]
MVQVPRPAATLILLRPGGEDIEVLMIQRAKSAAFLGGAYVFPGGALDAADSDLKRRILGALPPEPPAEYYI